VLQCGREDVNRCRWSHATRLANGAAFVHEPGVNRGYTLHC
jgi:hypothetical protein